MCMHLDRAYLRYICSVSINAHSTLHCSRGSSAPEVVFCAAAIPPTQSHRQPSPFIHFAFSNWVFTVLYFTVWASGGPSVCRNGQRRREHYSHRRPPPIRATARRTGTGCALCSPPLSTFALATVRVQYSTVSVCVNECRHGRRRGYHRRRRGRHRHHPAARDDRSRYRLQSPKGVWSSARISAPPPPPLTILYNRLAGHSCYALSRRRPGPPLKSPSYLQFGMEHIGTVWLDWLLCQPSK